MTSQIFQVPLKTIGGKPTTLAEYKGKVLLIVNVASQCGLTPQYEGLEKLYERYRDQGLVVLGFPANEFGQQEPGSNEEIAQFCQSKFGVQFPMFAKIVVKGEGQHPLYKHLTESYPEPKVRPESRLAKVLKERNQSLEDRSEIMWNFEKFLVDRHGNVKARFAPDFAPDDPAVIAAIESELRR